MKVMNLKKQLNVSSEGQWMDVVADPVTYLAFLFRVQPVSLHTHHEH